MPILIYLWNPDFSSLVIGLIPLTIFGTLLKSVSKNNIVFNFLKGIFLTAILMFIFITFSDFDSDGVINSAEIRNRLNFNSCDTDRDIMKDGFEKKHYNDESLFHPNNPDINNDNISDFCNAIIRHKVKNDKRFADLFREGFQRSKLINECDKTLNANNNFQICTSGNIDEQILLEMKCNDIAFAHIKELKEIGYYLQY